MLRLLSHPDSNGLLIVFNSTPSPTATLFSFLTIRITLTVVETVDLSRVVDANWLCARFLDRSVNHCLRLLLLLCSNTFDLLKGNG